jgi:hypothetical protein
LEVVEMNENPYQPPTAELQAVGVAAVGITGTVFVFLLSIQVYSTGLGVSLGILTLLPCVGLLGANLSEI